VTAPQRRDRVTVLLVTAFEAMRRVWEGPRQPRMLGGLLTAAFVISLAGIEAGRQGWLPAGVAELLPHSHFRAVELAFTLLLLFEVIGVVFSLAQSVSESVGKQFEIFSLILLRQTFEELSAFPEPVSWEEVSRSLLPMASDAGGALAVFVLVGVFYRLQRHRPITGDAGEQGSFVATKKAIAVLLLVSFVVIGVTDLRQALAGGPTFNFFEAFYTLLIFTDILLVLVSLRYSSTYRVVFRNSGFAAATLFLRLALGAPAYVNAAVGVAAALFACALTLAYNAFGASSEGASPRG
jgi:hypothetical protein